MSAFISLVPVESLRQKYFAQYFGMITGSSKTPYNVLIYMALLSGLRGSITIGGMAAAIKLMKHFYEKERQALLLHQEKTVAELQALKAQLHPHFLFNTLNNIYSHTAELAPVAANMLLGLSSLLRYMLYACNAPLVALEQEVRMMMEYIELKKKRYGSKLEVSIHTPASYNNLTIAPLLILPFVENCFKHGQVVCWRNTWVSIHIGLENSVMQLKIINGKAKNKSEETGGIGINNVRRRLELLYAGKHELSILNEDEVFIVNLQLQLTAPESSLLQRNYKNEPMNSRIYNCLVVDDSPPAREVLKRYIQKMRMLHLAGECSNALQVLPFLRNQPVDILLLDIQMPQLTGLELVNSLTNPPKNIAFFQL